MSIDEIEITGASLSFACMTLVIVGDEDVKSLFEKMNAPEEHFSIDPERQGFHDLDHDERMIRGYFSVVEPFEVEHMSEGITTKTLLKRAVTCEFFALDGVLFATGKSVAIKNLARSLTPLAGYGITNMEHDIRQMMQFQDRLSMVKKIKLTSPKDREIRTACLTGRIESYTDYNVIDPRNHGIESVCGLMDTPLGPITVTVTRKGQLRLGVRKGFVMTIDCLLWLMKMIRDEKAPENSTEKNKGKTS